MKLLFISAGKCQHMKDIIPGIYACAQLGEEFFPYLFVDYIEHIENAESGIILQTKERTIRKNYAFTEKSMQSDLADLRKMIWHYLVKDQKIMDITDVNGCLTDFRKYQPNNVIQGWQNKKRLSKADRCCKFIVKSLTSEIVRHNLLADEYRLSGKDIQNKNICKKVRGGECGDNYPPGSETYNTCLREVEWLCNNGYPRNKLVEKTSQIAGQIRKKIYDDLIKNDMKVNKREFDRIIDAGLFQDLGNRMGNKVANYDNVESTLDSMFDEKRYYLSLIEGFNDDSNVNDAYTAIKEPFEPFEKKFEFGNGFSILMIVLIILFLVYMERS